LLSKISRKGENGNKSILLNLERVHLLQTLIDNEMVFEHNQQQKLNVDESQQPNSSTSHSQQMKTIDRSIDCRICMETALSMAFIPCGHTLCNNCSEMILKDHVCCFCKQRISYVQKLYF